MDADAADSPTRRGRADRVKAFVREHAGLEPAEETRAYVTYQVGREREAALPALLKELEAERDRLGITDMQARAAPLQPRVLSCCT
jgi:hypothetical protein